ILKHSVPPGGKDQSTRRHVIRPRATAVDSCRPCGRCPRRASSANGGRAPGGRRSAFGDGRVGKDRKTVRTCAGRRSLKKAPGVELYVVLSCRPSRGHFGEVSM